ncbi:reverse transcriptase domain-containing protein [Tanacetum coccineum]
MAVFHRTCTLFFPHLEFKSHYRSVKQSCNPHDFKGTEGAIGLTDWFEKMEFVFHISDCAESWQVKYATCTLQDEALTWWNSYVKTMNSEAAYSIGWKVLKEMLIEEYCPSHEIQNIEAELWNLTVNGSNVVGYTRKCQELALLCPNIVPTEKKKIERYV